MKNDGLFEICQIGDRLILVRGVGKMYYQNGFPISLAISKFLEKGIIVSVIHVADELLKHGWSPDRTIKTLIDQFQDSVEGDLKLDVQLLNDFCYAEYENQRAIIFDYLFHGNVELAKNFFLSNA